LCAHGAREGRIDLAGGRCACAAQRADPGGDDDRPAGRNLARRRDPHRDDLLVARHRQVARRGDPPPRLSRSAGRHPDVGDRHHRRQPRRRHAVRRDQSADSPPVRASMSAVLDPGVAPTPPGPLTELWRDFKRNRGAIMGLAVVIALVLCALPSLLLAVAVVAILGPGLANAMYAIAIVMLPHFVRLTRAAVMGELAKDYVAASRIAGAGTARLMFDTVLPNCAAPLIVQATLGFSAAILDAAALGFLGLGAQPPTPEWGSMLASALEFIQSAWWVVTLPGLAILVSVLAFNLMGDGLRDALDPKLKR